MRKDERDELIDETRTGAIMRTAFLNMVLHVLAAAVLLAAIHTTADAQSINGTFHGTVTDPLGAVVAGAKVEVKNLASGEVRQATTNEDGFYTITGLAPG